MNSGSNKRKKNKKAARNLTGKTKGELTLSISGKDYGAPRENYHKLDLMIADEVHVLDEKRWHELRKEVTHDDLMYAIATAGSTGEINDLLAQRLSEPWWVKEHRARAERITKLDATAHERLLAAQPELAELPTRQLDILYDTELIGALYPQEVWELIVLRDLTGLTDSETLGELRDWAATPPTEPLPPKTPKIIGAAKVKPKGKA